MNTHEWTQFCPNCGYDLEGLPSDRCPECGNRFDLAELPLQPRTPSPGSSEWAGPALAAAIVLAVLKIGDSPGPLNTWFQLIWVGLMWTFAGVWVWLRRHDWSRTGKPHHLLWLLLVCVGMDRPNLPDLHQFVLWLWTGCIALTILLVAFGLSWQRSTHALVKASAVILMLSGGLAVLLVSLLVTLGGHGTYHVWGRTYSASHVADLVAFLSSLGIFGVGVLLNRLARWMGGRI